MDQDQQPDQQPAAAPHDRPFPPDAFQPSAPEPDTFEWHTARAREAIDREELDLAHAHLYLAEQLQNAIAMRAQAYLRSKLLTERFGKLSDEDLKRLDDLTARPSDGPSRVQHVHMVTDGHLGAGRLSCQACGTAVMHVREGASVSPGWWHLDGNGNPMGALDGHEPVLPS